MAHPTSDRNLLFGILALQLNFISKDALVAAMNAWVLDKDNPLGAILKSQGALPAEAHDLLSALVSKHVELHGGSAEQSLQALTSVNEARGELARIDDSDVQATLTIVGASRTVDPDATVAFTPRPQDSGLRYQILRPHAKGGLGQIYLAEDKELHRHVAFKEIQPQYAHDRFSRERFVVEAEITGGLEHPGIVPVYGLGTYSDGRPFYAMRFVDGDNLKQAIEHFHRTKWASTAEQRVAFRKLLQRFIDVCNAIAYAHSRGILHRDLKPGNVMLGRYGETLVVDWGLAKAMGNHFSVAGSNGNESTLLPHSASGSHVTLDGSVLGTPAYMSPEQAEGKLDELGPATDIYGLGTILYVLLTGVPPYDGASGDVLPKVKRGEHAKPREVSPRIPAALDAICCKAMATRADARYVSALKLAEDAENWLADEPVSAYQEPFYERMGRLARRRRMMVAAVGSFLLAVVVFVPIVGILLRTNVIVSNALQEEQRALLSMKVAEAEKAAADVAKRDAVEQKERADKERNEAVSQKQVADSARKVAQLHKVAADAGRLAAESEEKKARLALAVEMREKEKLAVAAILLLKNALANGYKEIKQLKQDPAIEPLRKQPEYQKLLDDLDEASGPKDGPKE